MHVSEALAFLETNHRAVMTTFPPGDRVQLSPVTVAAHPDGTVEVSSRETAFKVRHLRTDPRVSLCAFTDAFFGQWIQIDGTAEIVSLPEAMDGLVDYYRRASGEHPDWDDYRAAMNRDKRVLIKITPERVGPDQHG